MGVIVPVELDEGSLKNSLASIKRQLSSLNSRSLTDLSGGFKKSETSAKRVSNEIRNINNSLRRTAGLAATAFLGFAIGRNIKEAVSVAASFESKMLEVKAVTGAVGAEFNALNATARELGRTTVFTASQTADAMAFLGRTGYDTNETLSALPATLHLAASGGIALGEAADIASNVVKGFNLEASRTGIVIDIIAKASTTANTNISQMGTAMSYAAPTANLLGLKVSETAAAIGVLSDAGIQGEKSWYRF